MMLTVHPPSMHQFYIIGGDVEILFILFDTGIECEVHKKILILQICKMDMDVWVTSML